MVANGGVRCWGGNANGQLGNGGTGNLALPPSTDVLTGVSQISAGHGHTCVVMTNNGGVRCWGSQINGRLGNGVTSSTLKTPPSIDVLTGVSQILAGFSHTCALMASNGGVRCWGSQANGRLGNGQTVGDVLTPPSTDVLTGATQVVAAYAHTCVLMANNGGVRCWGDAEEGRLGNGASSGSVSSPPSSSLVLNLFP